MSNPEFNFYEIKGTPAELVVLDKERIAYLKDAILAGRRVYIEYAKFMGGFDLANLEVLQSLEFRYCDFQEHVDFRDSRFRNTLKFIGCKFHQSITLRGACVGAPLYLDHCTIGM